MNKAAIFQIYPIYTQSILRRQRNR